MLAVGVSATAQADGLQFRGGVGAWDQSYSGDASDAGNPTTFDLEDDLDLDDSTEPYLWGEVEHSVPFVPNVRVEYTRFDSDGSGSVTQSFTSRNQRFTVNEGVDTEFELDQTDLIGYYEILDNAFSLDAGLNVRSLDGSIDIESRNTAAGASESFSAPIPMAYLRARFDIPSTGWSVRGTGKGLAYDGSSLTDLEAAVGYDFDFGLGLELGYRQARLDVDEDSDIGDLDGASVDFQADGPFAGAYYTF